MVNGLDFFSKCAIAASGIADEADAEVAPAPVPIAEEIEED
jgi:hypothetical protein